MRAHEIEAAPGVHPAKARRITANIAKCRGFLTLMYVLPVNRPTNNGTNKFY
jgi:hypothetical protein